MIVNTQLYFQDLEMLHGEQYRFRFNRATLTVSEDTIILINGYKFLEHGDK